MESDSKNDIKIIHAAINLAEKCRYDKAHSHQVTLIALQLFDALKQLHNLGEREKTFLHAGAILHDIGWIEGQEDHHKTSRDLIVNSEFSCITEEEKIIIALIARYHRGTLPKKSHIYYSKLCKESREAVDKLAALIRIADGLDNTHMSVVRNLECEIEDDKVIIKIDGGSSEIDEANAYKKSDLFEKAFRKKIVIRWKTVSDIDSKVV